MIRAFPVLGPLVVGMLLLGSVNASAQTSPYGGHGTGYDVSYPQCPGTTPPSGNFGIVGVNTGRPFTFNGCLATEYSKAPQSPAPSLYINSAYAGAYRKDITPGCSTASASITGTRAQRQAWAIGCSEADTSANAAPAGASMWWLDVETGNSWSSSNQSLNRFAIQGAVSRLATPNGPPVGIYSTASMWTTITGGSFAPIGADADWVPSGSCGTGFAGLPVWLTQSVSGGVDYDHAC
jgi:hypothetical protein